MEVKNLKFSYSKNSPLILNGINLKIQEGKVTTILGPNGCGKSTLFSLMTKNLSKSDGEILLGNRDISSMSNRDFAKKVSIVHQYNKVSDDITVKQLVGYGRTPFQKMLKRPTEYDEKMIEWAIKATDLEEVQERTVNSLSGGQKQRVWIAMALAQGTKYLFLDEPTTYLDIKYQIEILDLVKNLNQYLGITIIMVLHDINQAMLYSDCIIGLKNGKVFINGNPKDIINEETLKEMYDIKLVMKEIDGEKIILNKSQK